MRRADSLVTRVYQRTNPFYVWTYGCVVCGSARASVLVTDWTHNTSFCPGNHLWCLQEFAPVTQLVCGVSSSPLELRRMQLRCQLLYSCHVCSFSSIKTTFLLPLDSPVSITPVHLTSSPFRKEQRLF
ncbi:hypothetical protein TNCV_1080581 [Trichonephila clavipes]|nr:hypothetical protein TNCV_1080581 [Trichonephila clavipes]